VDLWVIQVLLFDMKATTIDISEDGRFAVSVRYVTVSDPAFISSSETVVDGEMSS
jgi:hypothetical protein